MRFHLAAVSCAFLLGSAFLHAQDVPTENSQGEQREGRPPVASPALAVPAARPQGQVTGKVFCSDTHKPARGALVLVAPLPSDGPQQSPGVGGQAMVRVGNDGTYTAEHLAPGEYSAVAFQPGYLNGLEDELTEGMSGASSPARQREILSRNGVVSLRGSETATLDITLQRGATLSGRVLYSDGAPAAQITMLLEDTAAKPAKDEKSSEEQAMAAVMMRGILTHQSLSTDDEGHFRISGIKPGKYRLAATQPAQSLDTQSGGEGMEMLFGMVPDVHALHFYAGDTPHRAAAKVFELRSGDGMDGIEITMPVNAFHTVRGSISAVDGRAVNMGSIALTDSADDTLVFHAGIDPDGTFKLLQVPAGNYTLKAMDVRIGKRQRSKDSPAAMPDEAFPLQPTNAFADGSTSVLVKDNDVSDVTLSLSEVPLPKSESEPKPSDPDTVGTPQT